ncbi:hypothetical protein [Xanthomonas sp. NCPPB 2632]|uniref:hypothetical protein n=1 Tax=Xanthomonas sp. NCPPB 2632 TaxID=3240912 RepID=UPI003514ED72
MPISWESKAEDDLEIIYELRKNFAGVSSAIALEKRIYALIDHIEQDRVSHVPEFPPAPECRQNVPPNHYIVYTRLAGNTNIIRIRTIRPPPYGWGYSGGLDDYSDDE